MLLRPVPAFSVSQWPAFAAVPVSTLTAAVQWGLSPRSLIQCPWAVAFRRLDSIKRNIKLFKQSLALVIIISPALKKSRRTSVVWRSGRLFCYYTLLLYFIILFYWAARSGGFFELANGPLSGAVLQSAPARGAGIFCYWASGLATRVTDTLTSLPWRSTFSVTWSPTALPAR